MLDSRKQVERNQEHQARAGYFVDFTKEPGEFLILQDQVGQGEQVEWRDGPSCRGGHEPARHRHGHQRGIEQRCAARCRCALPRTKKRATRAAYDEMLVGRGSRDGQYRYSEGFVQVVEFEFRKPAFHIRHIKPDSKQSDHRERSEPVKELLSGLYP